MLGIQAGGCRAGKNGRFGPPSAAGSGLFRRKTTSRAAV